MTKSLRRKGFRQKNRKSRKQRVSRKRQMKGGYLKDLQPETLKNPLIMLGLSNEFLNARGKTLESLDRRTIMQAYNIRVLQLHADKHVLYPEDIPRANTYFHALTRSKERLEEIIELTEDHKNPLLNGWKRQADHSIWINWPFNKERPENKAVAHHLEEILQLTNRSATVHGDADVEFEVNQDVPTNYNAIVSNLTKEQKKWIRDHYNVLVLSPSVQKGLNDYNEMLKEIFKFYKL